LLGETEGSGRAR